MKYKSDTRVGGSPLLLTYRTESSDQDSLWGRVQHPGQVVNPSESVGCGVRVRGPRFAHFGHHETTVFAHIAGGL